MDQPDLEVKADFLEGRVAACPLVGGAESWPSSGQCCLDIHRVMYRSSWGLRKSLGSLSADGWGCVPAQLAARPDVSQHWHL